MIIGSIYRIVCLLAQPVPHRVPITPTAATRFGVWLNLVIETLSFRTLFRASFLTWILGWVFHVSLLLMFVIHFRYLSLQAPKFVALLMPHSMFIAAALILSLIGLLVRRCVVDRVRYVSSPSDYLHLLLLLVITGAGWMMARSHSANVYEVTLFVQGLFQGQLQPLKFHFVLMLHLLGAALLFVVYPFSKLFHGPLLWLNPTRTTADRARR